MKKTFLALGKCVVFVLWMALVYWVYLKMFHKDFDGAQWACVIGYSAIWLYFRNPDGDERDKEEERNE